MHTTVTRMISTLGVWTALTLILGMAISSSRISSTGTVFICGILAIVALAATRYIWRDAAEVQSHPSAAITDGKAKRNSRDKLVRLINALDDDEADSMLSDMRTRLASSPSESANNLGSDGEINDLDALLSGSSKRRG